MPLTPSRRIFLERLSGTVGTASLASVAGCFGMIGSDRARYFSVSEISVEEFDYETTKTAGNAVGYTVDGPYYGTLKEPSGIHPDGIEELDRRFGSDYRVEHVVFHHSSITSLRAWFDEGSPTELTIRDERAWTGPDPFLPEYLPDENWLTEIVMLLFDIGLDQAREYIDQFRDTITNEETDLPTIEVSEKVTFDAAHQYLLQESTAAEGSHSGGGGWHIVTYTRDHDLLAEVGFQLQSTKIIHNRGKGTYIVQFDPLGAVGLEITLPAGESIPEEERQTVFREMFYRLGFPPELVDDVEFEYVGSMW